MSTDPDPVPFSVLLDRCPRVGSPIRARFDATGLAIMGTLRRDGSPRVSPIEVRVLDGALLLGMMPGSARQLDVSRDPRCSLLTPVADKDDLGGEGKLFGRLVVEHDPARIAALFAAATDGTDYDAAELDGSPVYELRIAQAAWQHVDGDAFVTRSWSVDGGERHRRRVGATGASEEVALT